MNKQNFLTRMLLLLALIVGSVNGAWADNYEKVTSTAGITDGKYLIVYETGSVAFNGGLETLDAVSNTISVTINDSKIASTTTTDAAAFTIDVTNGTIQSASGQYIGVSSNSNGLKQTEDASTYTHTFSIDNGKAVIKADFEGSTMTLQYNKTAGQTRFRFFKSSQEAIQLYKLVSSVKIAPTITFNNGSVRVGKTLDLSTLFTSNSLGAVTYTFTSGGSNATIDGSTLTGIAEGSVTVKATQAASGAYNAGEKTATITVNAALTLSSIAITTVPNKTTYTEGETFDATGMVVTATYSDESTDDVTAYCSFSPSTALTTSDTEITVSYTENAVTKTATQAIEVNELVDYATLPFVWDGGKSAAFKALTGVSTSTLESDYADANAPYYIKFSETGNYIIIKTDCQPVQVAIGIKKVGGANTSTLTIQESADGENFNDVEELYTIGANTAVVNLNTTNKFDEASRYVRIYFKKEHNNTKGSNIGVGPITITKTEPIAVSAAGYATYVSNYDLDYSDLAVKAYKALVDGKTISFSNVTTVPAGEGVLLQGAEGTYNVPVAASAVAAWADNDNAFVRGSDAEVAFDNGNGTYNYVLSTDDNDVVGFYKAAGKKVAKNRAYLQSTTNAARLAFNFDDEAGEATGISEMKNVKADAAIYNLNGVRVKNMTKGLYIMNGKKVIVK